MTTSDSPAVTTGDVDTNEDGVLSEDELTALTKAQLISLASTLGVTGVSSSMTKAQIIAAILAAQG